MLLVALGVGGCRDEATTSGTPALASLGSTAEFAALHLAVDYPAAWQIEHASRLTRIIPPDDDVLITLGPENSQGASTACSWQAGDPLAAYADCWEDFYVTSPFKPVKRWSAQGGTVEVLELETSGPIGPPKPRRTIIAYIVGRNDAGEEAVGMFSCEASADQTDLYDTVTQMIETLRFNPVE